MPLATGLAPHWGRLSLAQQDRSGQRWNSGQGFWEHKSLGQPPGPLLHTPTQKGPWLPSSSPQAVHPASAPPQAAPLAKDPGLGPSSALTGTRSTLSPVPLLYDGENETQSITRLCGNPGGVAYLADVPVPLSSLGPQSPGWSGGPGTPGPEGWLASWSWPLTGSNSKGTCWTSHPHYSPLTSTFLPLGTIRVCSGWVGAPQKTW